MRNPGKKQMNIKLSAESLEKLMRKKRKYITHKRSIWMSRFFRWNRPVEAIINGKFFRITSIRETEKEWRLYLA